MIFPLNNTDFVAICFATIVESLFVLGSYVAFYTKCDTTCAAGGADINFMSLNYCRFFSLHAVAFVLVCDYEMSF